MYTRIYILVCALFCSLITAVVTNLMELQNIDPKTDSVSRNNKMRCTRRFTPGACTEPVIPVWTFVIQMQNCTERIGCKTNTRSNRFRRYRSCMKRCQPLIDMYLQILESEGHNYTYSADHQEEHLSRRESGDDYIEEVSEDDHYKEYEEADRQIANSIMNQDNLDVLKDIRPPDIDMLL